MRIGVPKEIKIQENRVGLVPASVAELVHHGHEVFVETMAGHGIGMTDAAYEIAGATVVESAHRVFQQAELIVKVKEPQVEECRQLTPQHLLFTFLHLAADKQQTELLMQSGCTAIAYETITDAQGGLPLLAPMSQIAGRMSVPIAARYLEEPLGGSGILLSGVPGVPPAQVLIIGAGMAGSGALKMAVGMEAKVTVMDKSLPKLQHINELWGNRVTTIAATNAAMSEVISTADVVIGAVLIPGAHAPKLVTRDMLKTMRKGSVLIDIAIDQGGCFETSRPTTHTDPVYTEEGILHYCVTNMPGALPRTSSLALNQATLPFILSLANKGLATALQADPHFLHGLNIYQGHVVNRAVAEALDIKYVPVAFSA